MKTFVKTAVAISVLLATAALEQAQAQTPTYYYCYAYGPSNLLWLAGSVKFGSQNDYAGARQSFVQLIRDKVQPSQLTASGCRPAQENADRSSVEGDRLDFIQRERNYGKSVEVRGW